MTTTTLQPTEMVFGPVPSRRLGRSLGLDPVPLKTCNWNCVYCQLGRTQPVVNDRSEFVAVSLILSQLEHRLHELDDDQVDWITIVGSGEPTLNVHIDELILGIKRLTPIPLAVITNGSLLHLPEVRRALLPADAVMPSVNAGTPELHRRINRPHPAVTYELFVEGLVAFRREYAGRYWPAVMLIRGLNDTPAALADIACLLDQVKPDAIHLNVPVRPPSESWVQAPDAAGLRRAVDVLGRACSVLGPTSEHFVLDEGADVVEAVVNVITRHPMRQGELEQALKDVHAAELAVALATLEESGQARRVDRLGEVFWVAAGSAFPEEDQSERTDPRTFAGRRRRGDGKAG